MDWFQYDRYLPHERVNCWRRGVVFMQLKNPSWIYCYRKLSWRLGEITHNPLHHNLKAILTDTFECRNIWYMLSQNFIIFLQEYFLLQFRSCTIFYCMILWRPILPGYHDEQWHSFWVCFLKTTVIVRDRLQISLLFPLNSSESLDFLWIQGNRS